MAKLSPAFRTAILSLLIIAAVFATFGRGISYPFLAYDDGVHIYANPYISPVKAGSLAHLWGVPFRPLPKLVQGRELPPYEQLYGPVAFTAWSLLSPIAQFSPPHKTPLDTLSPLNPAVYHFASIVLHGINAVLVFLLLRRVYRSNWVVLAALLWALHPLQVESVLWVTQMNTILCSFFSLLAAHLYLTFDRDLRRDVFKPLPLFASVLLLLLALLSKPLAAVTLLVVVGLVFLDRRFSHSPRLTASRLAPLAPWVLLCFAAVVINKRLQQKGVDGPAIPLAEKFFQVGDSFAFYLWKLFVPLGLAPDYGRRPEVILDHLWGYLTWILPVILVVAAVRLFRHRPSFTVGVAIFIGALLPTSGIVPYYYHWYSTVADRYAYFALLGPAFVLAGFLGQTGKNSGRPALPVRFLSVAGILTLAVLSYFQTGIWRNDLSLWSRGANLSPSSFLSMNNLAVAYMKNGQKDLAIQYFEKTLALRPKKAEAHYNLGWLLEEKGPTPEGLRHLTAAVELEPYSPENQNKFAVALAIRGRHVEAMKHWKLAVKIDPEYTDALVNLGVAHARLHELTQAEDLWRRALKVQPENPEAHFYLGLALESRGDLKGARREWMSALQARPGYPEALQALQQTGGVF